MLLLIEWASLIIFTLEVLLKIVAMGYQPERFFIKPKQDREPKDSNADEGRERAKRLSENFDDEDFLVNSGGTAPGAKLMREQSFSSRLRTWNIFDFVVVAATLLSSAGSAETGGAITVVRLLRVIKIVGRIDAFAVILTGLARGIQSVSSILLLLLLSIFLFAVVGRAAFGSNDPVHFGSTQIAMLTLFKVITACPSYRPAAV